MSFETQVVPPTIRALGLYALSLPRTHIIYSGVPSQAQIIKEFSDGEPVFLLGIPGEDYAVGVHTHDEHELAEIVGIMPMKKVALQNSADLTQEQAIEPQL